MDVSTVGQKLSKNIKDSNIRERLASITSPVTEQPWLDMLFLQWLFKKWILLQIEHTKTEVHGGMKIPSELVELIFAQRLSSNSRACLVVDRPLILAVSESALGHFGRHCTGIERSPALS